MLLKNKIAVIYGGGGAVGSAVAHAFAKEGARVFLGGRTIEKLDKVANEIKITGGQAEAFVMNALDSSSIATFLKEITGRTGRLDISFNAISLDDIQGLPLTALSYAQFSLPIINAINTHFLTATAAARQMALQGSGCILAITANAGHKPYENSGGFGIACATIEAFSRQIAVEEGKNGVRVACIRSAGSPDAPGVEAAIIQHAKSAGISKQEFEKAFAESTMLKRLPKLKEVADAAVLLACDKSSAITAAVLNVTCGELAD